MSRAVEDEIRRQISRLCSSLIEEHSLTESVDVGLYEDAHVNALCCFDSGEVVEEIYSMVNRFPAVENRPSELALTFTGGRCGEPPVERRFAVEISDEEWEFLDRMAGDVICAIDEHRGTHDAYGRKKRTGPPRRDWFGRDYGHEK